MVKKIFSYFSFLVLLLCLASAPVSAAEAGPPLQGWQGEFVSMHTFVQGTEFDSLYSDIAQAASKIGKDYTPAQVKEANMKMYATGFQRMTVTGDRISFYEKKDSPNPITVTYISKGAKETKFQNHTFTWHLFEATSTEPAAKPYRFLLATEIHGHKGGQAHWHLRCGQTGFDDLMNNPEYQSWWPTMVHLDFDTAAFIKGMNPKMMAKMLP